MLTFSTHDVKAYRAALLGCQKIAKNAGVSSLCAVRVQPCDNGIRLSATDRYMIYDVKIGGKIEGQGECVLSLAEVQAILDLNKKASYAKASTASLRIDGELVAAVDGDSVKTNHAHNMESGYPGSSLDGLIARVRDSEPVLAAGVNVDPKILATFVALMPETPVAFVRLGDWSAPVLRAADQHSLVIAMGRKQGVDEQWTADALKNLRVQ